MQQNTSDKLPLGGMYVVCHVSSTNKTDLQDIIHMLLKVELNIHGQIPKFAYKT
jgi:hypothetical protein